MDQNKLTNMSREAITDAVQSASAAGNAQIDVLHLLNALLTQEQGVVRGLIEAAGGDAKAIGDRKSVV